MKHFEKTLTTYTICATPPSTSTTFIKKQLQHTFEMAEIS
jgi:hypothetical protein